MNNTQSTIIKLFLAAAVGFAMLLPEAALAGVRPSTPVNIKIPQLKVNAVVEPRGLTARGLMQPPSTAQRVAWDRGTVFPGQPGEAVMYGHLTDNYFRPAVFYRLNYLNIGSRVVVTDSRGTVHTFKVTSKKAIRADRITYFDVVRDTRFIHLNVYTCAGRWDQRARRYTHFLVVYTTLISSVPKK